MPNKYLITGGAGFIGSNYANHLLMRGEQVVVLDNLSRAGSKSNIEWLETRFSSKTFSLIKADIRDAEAVASAAKDCSVILHAAGQVAVTTSVKDPREDFEINAGGALNVLEAARRSKEPPLVIYPSTNKVYGNLETISCRETETRYEFSDLPMGVPETQPLDFHSPYGCSKGAAEQYVRDYSRIYGVPTVVFRLSCIYGPRQFGTEDQGWISSFLLRAMTGKPIKVFGTGKQVRDILHVEDLVSALDRAVDKKAFCSGRIYNLGGGPALSISVWRELGPLLGELCGKPIPASWGEWRPGDQKVYISDTRKAQNELDWAPSFGLEEGVEDLYRWVLKLKTTVDNTSCGILTVLTYYRPHTSGLTIHAERLAKALVRQGHQVTVLTMHMKDLPRYEELEGVSIVRVPVLFRISKGCVAPLFGFYASKYALQSDVIHLHLPQLDAAGVAFRGSLFRKPTVVTYHCDLRMQAGVLNQAANKLVDVMNYFTGVFSDRIITYTEDYGDHSPYIKRHRSKFLAVLPPVELPTASNEEKAQFKSHHVSEGSRPVIGMAARLAAEKGVEVLLDALPAVLERHPYAKVLFAGQYQDVLAEEQYAARILPRIKQLEQDNHWKFVGVLSPKEIACFYPCIDVLTVPSLNSTESFGLVQIEAMMNGVPVVAANLPGVRQPVLMSGMGEIAEVEDHKSLARGLLDVLGQPEKYKLDCNEIFEQFNPDFVASTLIRIFSELLKV